MSWRSTGTSILPAMILSVLSKSAYCSSNYSQRWDESPADCEPGLKIERCWWACGSSLKNKSLLLQRDRPTSTPHPTLLTRPGVFPTQIRRQPITVNSHISIHIFSIALQIELIALMACIRVLNMFKNSTWRVMRGHKILQIILFGKRCFSGFQRNFVKSRCYLLLWPDQCKYPNISGE